MVLERMGNWLRQSPIFPTKRLLFKRHIEDAHDEESGYGVDVAAITCVQRTGLAGLK